MKIQKNLLKFIYNVLLIGTPQVTHNPINKNKLYVPLSVKPYSTYLNFKLNNQEKEYLNNYIWEYTNDLSLIPIKMSFFTKPYYYLSINIYNCSSPILLENKNITRCEINTYVIDKNGKKSTIILDYTSNGISMDPVNIYKKKDKIFFLKQNNKNIIDVFSKNDKINLKLDYNLYNNINYEISKKLIKYTDGIYYKNGILDKVYYDSTLVNAKLKITRKYNNFYFKYKDLSFKKIDSLFYFQNNIDFIGSMWHNL